MAFLIYTLQDSAKPISIVTMTARLQRGVTFLGVLMAKASLVSVVLSVACSLAVSESLAGERYAFLVGVGNYAEKELEPLKYARPDIIEFRDVLLESGVKEQNIVLMVDDFSAIAKSSVAGRYLPETEKIRKEFVRLLKSPVEDDTLIVAFAGHGVQFKGDKEPYFCPLNAELDNKESLISLDWIYKQMGEFDPNERQGCKARQKLLLVDACRKDPRSKTVPRSSGGPELDSVTRPQMAKFSKEVITIFSCDEGQQAYEHPPLEHGVFFYHILEAWRGKADFDDDRRLTLDELMTYARTRTDAYTRELNVTQVPQIVGNVKGIWNLRSLGPPKTVTNSIGMSLMLIPAGKFTMGSSPDDEVHAADENQVSVELSKSFYLGQTEVTQGQWKSVMGTEPWKGKARVQTGVNYPATYVSWVDATEFCKKLSAKEGKTYRLPTEAEWEFACRGGSKTAFACGDDAGRLSDFGWWGGGAAGDGNAKSEPFAHLVGQKKANALGLYDVHGNVWEWCQDNYENKLKGGRDPLTSTTTEFRVYRGGGWTSDADDCRSAYRGWRRPSSANDALGFRAALMINNK